MEQFIYIGQFKVSSGEQIDITNRVKKTGYKKLNSYKFKHEQTIKVAKRIDKSIEYQNNKAKNKAKKEARLRKRN